MRLALVQMFSEKARIAQNLTRTAEFVTRAVEAGADLVCFPEMSITGYLDPQKHASEVLEWGDPQLSPLFEASRKSQVTLVVGIVEANPGSKPFISQGIVQGGELLGVYRKNNVAPDEVDRFSSGTEPLVQRHNKVDFGLAICADIDNERLFQQYAASKAQVVLLPSAPGLDGPQETRNWKSGHAWWREKCRTQLGEYAKKYHLHIAVATQAGRTVDEDFPGGGYLFNDQGRLVAETKDWSESMLIVDIDL